MPPMMCMHNIRSLPLTGVGPVNIPPSMDLRPAFPPSRAVGGEWPHAPRSLARAHALHSGRSEEGIADTETREPARRGARTPPACLPRIDTPPHVGPTPTTITMTTYHHTLTSTKHPTKPERIIPHCFIAPTPSNALCLGCLYLTSFYRGGIPQVDIHTESGRTGLGGRDNWGRARLMRVHTPRNLACCGF